ncbi:hypothetical protein [Aequorivita vladivostokensis]|uniref:Glycosyltransferase n=1 Tax=Aequorivita vladivostokensis TaxID=171194 RepID=A0ABR5DHE9_9FLAO|nr:hypothetical protein [Aequorivita vladivostokensis]KJJ38205.1 hypothetical protein MB09_09060 [Aequorivita vladivostokensis]
MKLAPIILFVYNRPWHTEQTLEALSINLLADQSVLYIFSDGPKKDASPVDLTKIEEVRGVIRKKHWCKEIIIKERDQNLGLAESVIKGVTEVIEKHGRVIVLEDDILTGTYFLKFMNDALELYENESQVFGVSGYSYPSITKIEEPTYFLPIGSSWSYATWADRWKKVNFDSRQLKTAIDANQLKSKINFGNYPYYEMLEDQIKSKNDSWAIRFYASMFLNKGFFLFPNKSLVRNIGFDNSGIHCKTDNFFSIININNNEIKVEPLALTLNNKLVALVKQSFELRLIKKSKKSQSKTPQKALKKLKVLLKNGLKSLKLV